MQTRVIGNTDKSKITLVKNAIHNPTEPRHFMTITPCPSPTIVTIEGMEVARSERAVVIHEVAHLILDPVYYFPKDDVYMELFTEGSKTTHCPLRGEASYYDFYASDYQLDEAAWSYRNPISVAHTIRAYIAFDGMAACVSKECDSPE